VSFWSSAAPEQAASSPDQEAPFRTVSATIGEHHHYDKTSPWQSHWLQARLIGRRSLPVGWAVPELNGYAGLLAAEAGDPA
jgi:hypothetical protein